MTMTINLRLENSQVIFNKRVLKVPSK